MSGVRVYLDDAEQVKLMKELVNLRARVKEIADMGYYTLTEIRVALRVGPTPTTEDLRDETFKQMGRVHEWRNYAARDKWKKMSDLERLLDYALAERASDAEEWD